jgi:hypothetical protein
MARSLSTSSPSRTRLPLPPNERPPSRPGGPPDPVGTIHNIADRRLRRCGIAPTGAFLVGELERLDMTLHAPLVSVTWPRDITLREDVSVADEVISFFGR